MSEGWESGRNGRAPPRGRADPADASAGRADAAGESGAPSIRSLAPPPRHFFPGKPARSEPSTTVHRGRRLQVLEAAHAAKP
jgi:hypothetical protein